MAEVFYLNSLNNQLSANPNRIKYPSLPIQETTSLTSYRLVMECVINGKKRYFEFDTVDSWPINESTTITTQPLINGDVVADHVYREPSTIRVSGSFSSYGYKKNTYKNGVDRLKTIQEVFEEIMNKGLFCKLTFMSGNLSGKNISTRYIIRDRYVITGINWVPNQSSMEFTIMFTEVILGNVVEEINIDTSDLKLPSVSGAIQTTLKETFLTKSTIAPVCINILKKEGYTDNRFLEATKSDSDSLLKGSDDKQEIIDILNIAINSKIFNEAVNEAGDIVTAGLITGTAVLMLVPGANLLTAAGILGVSMLLAHFRANKLKVDKFKYSSNKSKLTSTEQKFIKWVRGTSNYVNDLESKISGYLISKEEIKDSREVQVIIPVGGGYYQLSFSMGNDDEKFTVAFQNLEGNLVGKSKTVPEDTYSIFDLDDSNLFGSIAGENVYVFNAKLSLCKDDKERKEALKDISNYVIITTTGDMRDFKDMFNNLIKSYLYK